MSGIDRLYVHAADTKKPVELSRYLRGLAPGEYCLSGAGPMRLVISFPRPRLSVLSRETESERGQRWLKALTELPVRRAVLRLASGNAGTVQVMEVADPTAPSGFERFLSAAVAGSGQSAREVEQAQVWRRDEVERISGGPGQMGNQLGKRPKSVLPTRPSRRVSDADGNREGTPTVTREPNDLESARSLVKPETEKFAHGALIAEDGSLA